MKLKPYPKYKDSGIEWIGEIPEGWEVKRLKYLCKRMPKTNLQAGDGSKEGNYPFFTSSQIISNYTDEPLLRGEFLILGTGGEASIHYYNGQFSTTADCLVLKVCKAINTKYLYYFLYSNLKVICDLGFHGMGLEHLQKDFLFSFQIFFSTVDHQTSIANFLDQKTAMIDELIKKNKRLIELLKEKRQAIISHAVTKGIPPRPPLEKGGWGDLKIKDSGIEWLGEIPEGWEVFRLKHLAGNNIGVVQTGPFGAQLHASDYVDEGVPLILIRNVNNLWIDDSNIPKISEEKAASLSMYCLKVGDIVFSRVGSIGRIALVTEREEGWLISGQMLRIRIKNPKLDNHFLLYVVSSNLVSEFIQFKSVGSTRDSINTDILRNVYIPLPPSREQESITDYLDQKTVKIDELINKIQSQIEKLKEYRQALISNVVTGKVMVGDI